MTGQQLHIGYRRSGGFAGIETTADLDADELSADAAEIAARLLSDPASGAPVGTPRGADQFNYRLELQDGSRRHTFEWTDLTVPADVRPLLSELNRRAAPPPR
jgi:hypothetical protein